MRLSFWILGRELLAIQLTRAKQSDAEAQQEYISNTGAQLEAGPTDDGTAWAPGYGAEEYEDHQRMGFWPYE